MKKYFLKIALFFALVYVMDVVCGWAFGVLRGKARGGQTQKNEYISKECEDDILILGSSKADHHYVPKIICDSLGMSCYNCGQEGNGIVAAYARYKMVSARKKPQLVVYEITPRYDYLKDNEYSGYLGVIRQYISNNDVRKEYLDFSDNLEGFRLMSNMYCNNSRFVITVKDVLRATPDRRGYEPLTGRIKPRRDNEPDKAKDVIVVDTLKLSYVERLVKETKRDGVQLVMMISPTFEQESLASYEPALELCARYGIPLINNVECVGITGNAECFQDKMHLNNKGAVAYSKFVAHQLKELIKTE